VTDTETRIEMLEARAALLRLLHASAQGYDNRDPEMVRSLWHEDAVLELGELGSFHGIDEIVASAKQFWAETPHMHHWMANPLLEIDLEAGTATASTALDCLCTFADGGTSQIGGRYRDKLVRIDGRWLIFERRLDAHFVTPLPDWKPEQGSEAEPVGTPAEA
jgi:SnoaL-like domain